MTKTKETYLQALRTQAQSVLAGVQRLEELEADEDDAEYYCNPAFRLGEADADIWSLVDWIEGGRCRE